MFCARKRSRRSTFSAGEIFSQRSSMMTTVSVLLMLQVSICSAFVLTNDNTLSRQNLMSGKNNVYASCRQQEQQYIAHTSSINRNHQSPTIAFLPRTQQRPYRTTSRSTSTSSALQMVWFFGGSDTTDERTDDDESCELVAVRIERTSANSRRIFGEITAQSLRMDDVWKILTDYDNLSTHVPNLVESRIVQRLSGGKGGDGQYSCRLFQKGAQKIIGFEFGASVTMDMKESFTISPSTGQEIRKINFKCYDSFFFQEFDGSWEVTERYNSNTNEIESIVSYVVEVRPKGPVPVAALEWRIREDVPTNLRAVKKAATSYSAKRKILFGSSNSNNSNNNINNLPSPVLASSSAAASNAMKNGLATIQNGVMQARARASLAQDARMKIQWYKDETMAAYLSDSQT
jgi:Polyketide cyclase / dehydrase and lipid transport